MANPAPTQDLAPQQRPQRAGTRAMGMAAAAVTLLFAAACGGGGQGGQLSQPPPTAVAATVGQAFTVDSSGVMQTTVRAGADVVLTGTNSHKGTTDAGVPIVSYSWTQVDAGTTPVNLIERTADTVSFTAPSVTRETKLTFRLTVADADGVSSSIQAMVTVEPVRDSDHFLEFVNVNTNFTVVAATRTVVPGAASVGYAATLPFTVTVTKLVSFTDINGVRRSNVAIGKPVTYSSGWSASLGTGGLNCADARNPQLQIPIPRLELDDSLADGSGPLSNVLETSDVEPDPPNPAIPPAVVSAQVEIQSASLPQGVTPEVCVNAPGGVGTPASAVTASSDSLKAPASPAGPYDSNAAAHAYYSTIDPSGSKSTLSSWLAVNGFNSAAPNWGADAHAVYTNNYDLGFGRDMYMKFGACDSGVDASMPLQARIGKCDVASVVMNYAGVQAAGYRLNPIVAVAMEYSATPGTSPTNKRFTKFFVFAPDTRTGAFQRVTSVDLDRRGQKPVPQSCIVCHGGTPGLPVSGATAYPNGGDLGSGFLPWDLDSFLFTDTDPGFSAKPEDAALKAQYTRASQEAQLKLLNAGAYLTFDDPNRFALQRELLEGWYGGEGMPKAVFDGTFVPPGWQPGGTNQNPADSATLYTGVFARHCRACHALQEPALQNGNYVDPRTATQMVSGSPVSTCSAQSTTPLSPVPVGANQSHQIPMSCYWQFAHSPFFSAPLAGQQVSTLMASSTMPFARRTLDRMWVQPDGSTSAGAMLQSHFAAQTPAVTLMPPGTSIATITTPTGGASNTQITVAAQNDVVTGAAVDIGSAVRLDSSRSTFPDAILWSASACAGTPASPGDCSRSVPVVGADTPVAWLIIDDAVTYRITLQLNGAQGLATSAPFYYQVPEVDPTLVSPAPAINVSAGGQVTVMPASLFTYGNGGLAGNRVLLVPGSGLAVTPATCMVAPGCTGTDIAAGFVVQSTGTAAATSSIALTVTGSGSSSKETTTGSVVVNIM